MTAAEQAIADLDAALATDGECIELWHETGAEAIPFKVRCRAFVRGYAAQELVGGIAETDSKVIISPTEITRAGWPGPNSSATPTDQDRRVPRKGSAFVVVAGRKRAVEAAGPISQEARTGTYRGWTCLSLPRTSLNAWCSRATAPARMMP